MLAPGFIGIGLVPDLGGAHSLARILGIPRAFEWMSSGRRLTAAEAQAWGLVSEVYESEAFEDAAAAYAAEWAAKPTRGVALTKRLFDEGAGKGLEETLALEAEPQG